MAKKAKKSVKAKKSEAISKAVQARIDQFRANIGRDDTRDAIDEIVQDLQKQWKRRDGIRFDGSRWQLRSGEKGYRLELDCLGEVFVVRTYAGYRIRFTPAPKFIEVLRSKGIDVITR